jgi:hypothetical protein
MGETKLISPALLQRHLHKVDYPASRDDLIAHARSECERVISALQELPDRTFNRPTDVSKAFAELARQNLAGMSYPASRDDLVEHAKRQGAAKAVIEALKRIPDRTYDGPEAVAEAVAEEEE